MRLLRVIALLCSIVVGTVPAPRALAFSIELDDAAPMRIEQQRQEALGRLPLPGTPALARRDERLKEAGLKPGDPVFIRIFKAEAELELWMQKGDAFVLFATYPICFWSGSLGPKLTEGDNQTPEGFYTVTRRQLHRSGRHPRSLNLGFPNAFDRVNARTGSYILVHGACSSIGCYAMTDPVADEIFELAERALYTSQDRVHVHAFPFRMTDENLDRHAASPWASFWQSLKPAFDAFEATRLPPVVGVCERGYAYGSGKPADEGDPGPLGIVRPSSRASQRLACLPSTPGSQLVAQGPLVDRSVEDRASGSDHRGLSAWRRRGVVGGVPAARERVTRLARERRRAARTAAAGHPGELPAVFRPQ